MSAGVRRASEVADPAYGFCADAMVAREPWCPLDVVDCPGIVRDRIPRDWSKSVAVVAIDGNLIAELHDCGIADAASIEDVARIRARPSYIAAEAKLLAHVTHRFASSLDRLRPLGTSVASSHRMNTSWDSERRCYNGLHVDSWDRLPMAERHSARNRIAVNLGRGDRWFLFAGYTIQRLSQIVGNADPRQWSTTLVSVLRDYPSMPIFKLRIAPGEAYIAPTDNLVHDGTTVGNGYPDICLTALGDFHATSKANDQAPSTIDTANPGQSSERDAREAGPRSI
jgi:hypothetical protein